MERIRLLQATAVLVGVATTVVFLRKRRAKKRRGGYPLPPGPKGLPVLGNALQMPQEEPWKVYNEWSKLYGGLTYMEAMGQPIVILNSMEAIQELLVKRSSNYADRTPSPIFDIFNISSWDFALMPYGRKWRDYRRTFHQFFVEARVPDYHPIIEQEMKIFLNHLHSRPDDFLVYIKRFLGAITMRVSYGSEDPDYNQSIIDPLEEFAKGFVEYAAPGRLLVSVFPILRHVPAWFPGAGWKRTLLSLRASLEGSITRSIDDVQRRLDASINTLYPNVAAPLLEALPDKQDPEYSYQRERVLGVAAISYIAGIDTMFSTTSAIFLALAMHPDVRKKAQHQIDSLTGTSRLPSCPDTSQLPYVQAIVKEVMRWFNTLPLGIPHMSQQDDVYDGYFIPGGSWFLANTWAILHDPARFEDPLAFNPDRYLDANGNLDPNVLDPELAFGFGRRICPGRHFGIEVMTLTVACVLAVFDLEPPLDDRGKTVPLELRTGSQALVTPLPFECRITMRSPAHATLIGS